MTLAARCALALLLALYGAAGALPDRAAAQEPTVVLLVRHAE